MMVTDVTAVASEASSNPVRIPQPERERAERRARTDNALEARLLANDRIRDEVLRIADYEAATPNQVKVDLSVDTDSGQSIFRVVDSDSNEVIREIPTEESRRIRQKLTEIMGLVFDREA